MLNLVNYFYKLQKILTILIILLFLNSCGGEDECIPADDFGNYTYSQKTLIPAIGSEYIVTPSGLEAQGASDASSLHSKDSNTDSKDTELDVSSISTVSSVVSGTTENQAYLSAWQEIRPKGYVAANQGSSTQSGDFIVKADSIISAKADGYVDLANKTEAISLLVDNSAIANGVAPIYSTKASFDPGTNVNVSIIGKIKTIDGATVEPREIIAFHIDKNINSNFEQLDDTNAWICNIGSIDNYSSSNSDNATTACDFVNGDNCDPISYDKIITAGNYSIFGTGYIDGGTSGRQHRDTSTELKYEMYSDNSGFAICTSNKTRYVSGSAGNEYIGWSDSDYPSTSMDALTGTYFNKTCESVAKDYNITNIAQNVGGLVKYAVVSNFDRSNWAQKNYIIDSKYPSLLSDHRKNKNPDGQLTICPQPTFKTIKPKQIFLFRSLSNDPLAHRGFNVRRNQIENNTRNGVWKTFLPPCGIGGWGTEDVDKDYVTWKFSASFFSRPDQAYKLLIKGDDDTIPCQNSIKLDNTSLATDSNGKYITNPDGSYQVTTTQKCSMATFDWPSGVGDLVESGFNSCSTNAYSSSCAGRVQENLVLKRDMCYWDDLYGTNEHVLGAQFHSLIGSGDYDKVYGDLRPSCNISINGSTSNNVSVNMDDNKGWIVYPESFPSGTSISITSNRLSNDTQNYMYNHEMPQKDLIYTNPKFFQSDINSITISESLKAKLSTYGWCYERSPCTIPSKRCDSYVDKSNGHDELLDESSYNYEAKLIDRNGDAIPEDISGIQCKNNFSQHFNTDEYNARKREFWVKNTYTGSCGSGGDVRTPTKKAIYCHSRSNWKPKHSGLLGSTADKCSLIPTSISGRRWNGHKQTPSISSHNLYCHPNKTRECGIAMGFRTFSGEIQRCISRSSDGSISGYTTKCSEDRYKVTGANGSAAVANCSVKCSDENSNDCKNAKKRSLGICIRTIKTSTSTSTSIVEGFLMSYYDSSHAAAKDSVKSPSYGDLKQSFKLSNSITNKYDGHPFTLTDGVNLEMVDASNCGICLKKALTQGGFVQQSDLKDNSYSQSDCSDSWVTSYATKSSSVIVNKDHNGGSDGATMQASGSSYNVTYSFTPVSKILTCDNNIDQMNYFNADGTTSDSAKGILKSMNGINYRDSSKQIGDHISGRLLPIESMIGIPDDFGKSRISVYFAGEKFIKKPSNSNVTGLYGFQNIMPGSKAIVVFNSSSKAYNGKFLYLYIQPIAADGFPDPLQAPKVKFATKKLFLNAILSGDPNIINFGQRANQGIASFAVPSTGKVWAIIYDAPSESAETDHDGKYINFNTGDQVDPLSTDYENMSVNADSSNVNGNNSGYYNLQLKVPDAGSSQSILEGIIGFGANVATLGTTSGSEVTSLPTSLIDDIKNMLFGKATVDSSKCSYVIDQATANVVNGQKIIKQSTSTKDQVYSFVSSCVPNSSGVSVSQSKMQSSIDLSAETGGKYRYFCNFKTTTKATVCKFTNTVSVPAATSACTGGYTSEANTVSGNGPYSVNYVTPFNKNWTTLYNVSNQDVTNFFKMTSITSDVKNTYYAIVHSCTDEISNQNSCKEESINGITYINRCGDDTLVTGSGVMTLADAQKFVSDTAKPNSYYIPKLQQTLFDINTPFIYKQNDKTFRTVNTSTSTSDLETLSSIIAPYATVSKNCSSFYLKPKEDFNVSLMSYFLNKGASSQTQESGNKTLSACFYDKLTTTDDNTGSLNYSFSIYHMLDKIGNYDATCQDIKSTFPDLTMSEYSITSIPSNNTNIIPPQWCVDNDCSNKTNINGYIDDVQNRIFTDTNYSCDLRKCSGVNFTNCSTGKIVNTLMNVPFPEKYGNCGTSSSSGSLIKCDIFMINPLLTSYNNIKFCMTSSLSATIMDNGNKKSCWTKKTSSSDKTTENVISNIYGNDDYSNGTYLEAANPIKQFTDCSSNPQDGSISCTMIDTPPAGGGQPKSTSITLLNTLINGKNLSNGEDINSAKTRVEIIGTPTCTKVSEVINKSKCALINDLSGYKCALSDDNFFIITKSQYFAGGTFTYYNCTIDSPCQDATHGDNANATASSSSVQNNISMITPSSTSKTQLKKVCSAQTRDYTTGFIYTIFMTIVGSAMYQALFYMLVVFYIIIIGYKLLNGEIDIKSKAFISQFIRFGIVATIASPSGWSTYQYYFVGGAINLSEGLNQMAIQTLSPGQIGDAYAIFAPLSDTVKMVFTGHFMIKLLAGVFSLPYGSGIIISFAILSAVLSMIIVLAKAIVQYLSSMILLALYLSIGPLVVIGYLFDKFKGYYEKWIKNIITAIAEQFFLFLGVSLFCMMSKYMLQGIIYKSVCWRDVLSIPLNQIVSTITLGTITFVPDIPILKFWKYEDSSGIIDLITATQQKSPYNSAISASSNSGMPTLASIFGIMLFSGLADKFLGMITDLAKTFGGSSSTGALNGIMDAVAKTSFGKGITGLASSNPIDLAKGSAGALTNKIGSSLKDWNAKQNAFLMKSKNIRNTIMENNAKSVKSAGDNMNKNIKDIEAQNAKSGKSMTKEEISKLAMDKLMKDTEANTRTKMANSLTSDDLTKKYGIAKSSNKGMNGIRNLIESGAESNSLTDDQLAKIGLQSGDKKGVQKLMDDMNSATQNTKRLVENAVNKHLENTGMAKIPDGDNKVGDDKVSESEIPDGGKKGGNDYLPSEENTQSEAKQAQEEAEDQRIQAEKQAEEQRIQAEKQAEEQRIQAEKQAEEQRIQAEKQAEEQRIKAKKQAEEQRIKAKKQAEEQKKIDDKLDAEYDKRIKALAEQQKQEAVQQGKNRQQNQTATNSKDITNKIGKRLSKEEIDKQNKVMQDKGMGVKKKKFDYWEYAISGEAGRSAKNDDVYTKNLQMATSKSFTQESNQEKDKKIAAENREAKKKDKK